MDDDKKTQNDEITTNAEYVDQAELDDLVDKNGEPIDAIERDQDEAELLDQDAKKELRKALEGNDDNAQDEPLDEENY